MNNKSLKMDISPLAYDYIHAYENVGDYFVGDFRRLAAFRQQAEKVESRKLRREPLAAILSQQNREYGCASRTLDNIDKLIRNQTCAVVTGQQVGLFSGPLYTIYKSLTVIRLAEYLDKNCKGSFVPVFWLASDDHDFAEIDHINLLDRANRIAKIQCRVQTHGDKIPASKLLLTQEIADCFRHLDDSTRNSEFKREILSHLAQAYRPGLTFADAFARWMTRLFGSYGLVMVDASHPGLKELGKNVFAREIAENSPSTERALETSNRLKLAGYRAQVHLKRGMLNLFFAERERKSIQSKGDDFYVKDGERAFKKSELLALLDEKPEIFSPNVLLRPIFQDAILPTAAYVGGPSEIAYFAQMKGVYESFGLAMPVVYPRKTVTIVEKNVGKVLEAYDVKIQDIWRDADRMIEETIKKQLPGSIDRVFRKAASHLGKDFESIKREATALDPTLEGSADLVFGRMNRQLEFLEKKILRTQKKRNGIMIQQLQKARNSLYPGNRLQERALNIVPFLIKYDFGFLDKLCRDIEMENFDHQVIRL